MTANQPPQVTIYSAAGCVACKATERALVNAGIALQVVDLASLPPERIEKFKEQGHGQAPIVQTPTGEAWSGFRPDKIRKTAREHGASKSHGR